MVTKSVNSVTRFLPSYFYRIHYEVSVAISACQYNGFYDLSFYLPDWFSCINPEYSLWIRKVAILFVIYYQCIIYRIECVASHGKILGQKIPYISDHQPYQLIAGIGTIDLEIFIMSSLLSERIYKLLHLPYTGDKLMVTI